MILSRSSLLNIDQKIVSVPKEQLFNLPEKVLQFGAGVLLRGLPDYFIDKANKQGFFNGRVVVVKSTATGGTFDFDNQNGLYTICVRGVEQGVERQENLISASISRVISADEDWRAVLGCALAPELAVIISNTTEVGIQLLNEKIMQFPPKSFPAKLLAVLYHRFLYCEAGRDNTIVVVPTELIPENGKKLKKIIDQLCIFNELESGFTDWMEQNVAFCNSLVDRIVPGKPDQQEMDRLARHLGYVDQLLTMVEPYRLWAIEGDERVADVLTFRHADAGVIVQPDIEHYRALKLSLLNGTHTLTCGLAVLAGEVTVRDSMQKIELSSFIKQVLLEEIMPSIPGGVPIASAEVFAGTVLDRFSNPFIEHLWINITVQYSMKMKVRVLPLLQEHYKNFGGVPKRICLGFASFLSFMRVKKSGDNLYSGDYKGITYQVTDDEAAYFSEKTKMFSGSEYVSAILGDRQFWGTDLAALEGFIQAVQADYLNIQDQGVLEVLKRL